MFGSPADAIRNGLIQRGLPAHVADGFVMNFRDESGLNPGINELAPTVPGSRGGFGLAQWTGPRRVALETFAQDRGLPLDAIDTQLDFLMTELQGPESRASNAIMAAPDSAAAADAVLRTFLRPAAQHVATRSADYLGGGLLSGGGTDTMTGSAGGDRMATQGLLSAPQDPARRPSIWDRLEGVPILGGLADPDRRARLAIGLGGMSLNPNQMLMAMNAQGIQDRATERETAGRLNQTIAYLQSIGRDDLVALAQVDPGAALATAMQPPDTGPAPIEVNGQLVNPVTGEVIGDYRTPESTGTNLPADVASLQWRAAQMGLVKGTPEYTAFIASNGAPVAEPSDLEPAPVTELRKTWEALPAVRAFQTQAAGFSRLDSAAAQGNATGDMALIFSFMKLLDPASTVREGEAAQTAQAPGVANSIISEYNRALNGQVLTDARRAEILATARATYNAAEQGYNQLYDQYARLASGQGFDPATTLTDYRYRTPAANPEPPAGFNPAPSLAPATSAAPAPTVMPGPNNVPSPATTVPPRFIENQTLQQKAQELGITMEQMWGYIPEDVRAQWLN